MNFEKYINAAKESPFKLRLLNIALFRMIPFNKPHGIKIKTLKDHSIETVIPYKRKNFNHIKGVHACGMATCAEFASGFLLLTQLGFKKYRLIMETIEMKYHYQAKTDIIAQFSVDENFMQMSIVEPLKSQDAVFVKCQIELYDTNKNHVATGFTNWQIKDWNKVKTKL